MKKILFALFALLLLVPLHSQPVKKTFTGTLECMRHIPVYKDGVVFYVNPYPGGQSGSLVVLDDGSGNFRVWDNDAQKWVTNSLEGCSCAFFINPDKLFLGKKNNRCGFLDIKYLDGFVPDDKNFLFTDWRFKQNSQKQIEYVPMALGEKWGVADPDTYMIVPTRYDSPEKAIAAIAERRKAEKPVGMSDMEFMAGEIHDKSRKDLISETLHLDWEWYDPVSGTLFYTLEELPWCGPFYRFTDVFDYEPEVLEEGSRHALWNVFVGVSRGVLSVVFNPGSFPGPVLPLSTEVCRYLSCDHHPVMGAPGDVFYGYKPEGYGYSCKGIRINKDNSFQLGFFRAYDEYDGSVDIRAHTCIPKQWDYDAFFRHYVSSAKNKGDDPQEKEVVDAFRKQLEDNMYYKLYYDRFSIWNTYSQDGTITVFVDPGCEVKVPVTKARAAAFSKDYDKHWDDTDYYKVEITRNVRDDGTVDISYLYISSPGGGTLEYLNEEYFKD